ncbi:MAG: tRNA-(ms[2]io[6]A)-hydroxylase [Myxococcota bacterium]
MRLRVDTPESWIDAVNGDVERFLQDHASCEKKAVGTALGLASHYPDRTELVGAMIELAQEELCHYREVFELLSARGLSMGRDQKDPYIRKFLSAVRNGAEDYFLDRLLVFGIVEARGCERFRILADGFGDVALQSFYRDLAQAEARHWALFVRMAKTYFPREDVDRRLDALLDIEGEIVSELPVRCALH